MSQQFSELAGMTALQAAGLTLAAYSLTPTSAGNALVFGVASALGSRYIEKTLDDHGFYSWKTVSKYAIGFFGGIGIGVTAVAAMGLPLRVMSSLLSTTGIAVSALAVIAFISLYISVNRPPPSP